MSRYYSQLTGCTYLTRVHSVMPEDAKLISEERYLSVIAEPAPGKVRGHDLEGLPILIDPPPMPLDDQLKRLYNSQFEAINRSCELAITGGFWSSALGAPYLYNSQLDDQLNLTGVILAGLDTLYACRDEAGVKDFRDHTLAQIRQVGDDFTAFKLQLLRKANQLKQQLDKALAAGDLAAIEAVTWESVQ
ncbi:hypothetical protein GV819_23715 [Pseudomonas sp. Fl5BN2]|uniref:DUF4376 domain-containing protein n=1 Tax=Pseudomonas sp. Fl5BN2 TaxID=2697652 RepID=UPI0013782B2F|nr:hypothetical protein [Pseudomonas sp. Fl5BN2]NBF05301.1 hypothetical protein [Pseudomonas sp. Fl5BN2]